MFLLEKHLEILSLEVILNFMFLNLKKESKISLIWYFDRSCFIVFEYSLNLL